MRGQESPYEEERTSKRHGSEVVTEKER